MAFFNPTTAPYNNPAKSRKVTFVTGAHGGIGFYTALHLYLHGYVVYLAGRTEEKVTKAIRDLETEAASRIDKYTAEEKQVRFIGELHYIHIDLLDLASVVTAANDFKKREPVLDILINNAGIMGVPYEVTKDGFEIQYQVNYVAHLLLISQLVPLLKKSSHPRIVLLTSIGHNLSYKYFAPGTVIKKQPEVFFAFVRYGVAKTAEIHGIKKLALLFPDIVSLAVHPGVITDTELYKFWQSKSITGFFTRPFLVLTGKVIGVGLEDGATATLRAALDDNISTQDSGKYYVTGGAEATPSKVATNEANIDTTWSWTLDQLRLRGFDVSALE